MFQSSKLITSVLPSLSVCPSILSVYTCAVRPTRTRLMATSPHNADRLSGNEKNLWIEFTGLARDYKAVNLGQGFPDFQAPEHVRQALVDAVSVEGEWQMHQYTRGFGHPRLVNALSRMFSPLHGREINANTEILCTVGGYQALNCCFTGLVNPGDEVIIIEPFFDCYAPMARLNGAVCKYVPLRPSRSGCVTSASEWKLDQSELEAQFSEKTKLIVVNTPNNPLGKVYTRDELQMIADLCIKYDVICISDEVYEHMTYSPHKHVRIATLPGMWERTVTISSAGKTFSVTGWKLGWAIGPEPLIQSLCAVHQNCVYTIPTPLQEAAARAVEYELERLDSPDCIFKSINDDLQPKMKQMAEFLEAAGLNPVIPDGGYFMMAEIKNLLDNVQLDPADSDDPQDARLVRWLTKNKKLAAIPPSAFYSKEHAHIGEQYIRFCFIKKDETLNAAFDIIKQL